jgi:EF-P beta-lysylation protein EpmB
MTLPLVKEDIHFEIKRMPLWRTIMRQNYTKLAELVSFLELSSEQLEAIDFHPDFALNLPRRLASKMAKSSLSDPLFRQFVPLKEEKIEELGFLADPVQDARFSREDKLLQKYTGRALVIATSACGMHCRYCFRKNFDYKTEDKSFANELEIIQNDPSLEEIILSGGDPLSLSDETLGELLSNLSRIAHVRRIRFHTRFPIGIPERIDSSFLSLLAECPKQIWFVIHANSAQEFDEDVWEALKKVRFLGIPVLNQSVLLRGVNDSLESMKELLDALIDHGIMPYYLHQLDKVQGAGHFETSIAHSQALLADLMTVLPGYAVPKLAQEIPGKPNKTLL